jgi:hypothetical protein
MSKKANKRLIGTANILYQQYLYIPKAECIPAFLKKHLLSIELPPPNGYETPTHTAVCL